MIIIEETARLVKAKLCFTIKDSILLWDIEIASERDPKFPLLGYFFFILDFELFWKNIPESFYLLDD